MFEFPDLFLQAAGYWPSASTGGWVLAFGQYRRLGTGLF
jgi:hypothetical protein